ncbi:phosphoglycerate kinase [Candidatus Woesearchaeota archaeon]|nr:phosphoglycerate kinase [Candidatus Woesearchaeota archaeon]
MRLLKKANIHNKKIILRVDFNVPLKGSKIVDDSRIKAALPTIKYLVKNKNIILLLSHLGKPEYPDPDYCIEPIAKHLSTLLKKQVIFVRNPTEAKQRLSNAKFGDVLMLENIRFFPGETKNTGGFANSIASLGDVYVNDAFAACHREHATIVSVPKMLPSYAGFLIEKEVIELSKLFKPKKPFMLLLGGAKVSTKIELLSSLGSNVSEILVGGAMAFTFLKAQGYFVGKSFVEDSEIQTAKDLLKQYKIILPLDVVTEKDIVAIDNISEDQAGFDIGPKTVQLFCDYLLKAKTVFWNGPLGLYENEKFQRGTFTVAKSLAKQKSCRIVGGGDTVAAISELNLVKKFSHVSTGGGAALAFLAKKTLPGIEVLK